MKGGPPVVARHRHIGLDRKRASSMPHIRNRVVFRISLAGAVLMSVAEPVGRAAAAYNADALVVELKKLEAPINDFIDGAMVMSEIESERFARLSLLQAASQLLLIAGDFTKLQG
jgi:glycyl-tRNA synthetase beta subunit